MSTQLGGATARATEEGDDGFWKGMFDVVVSAFPDPVFVIDAEGTITHWNDAARSLTGMSHREVVGRNAYDVFQTDGESETLAETVLREQRAIKEDQIRSATGADGETFHNRAMALPIRDGNDEVVGAFEVIYGVTDIVEQRRLLETLQHQMAEDVRGSIVDLRGTVEDVAERSEEIEGLANEQ